MNKSIESILQREKKSRIRYFSSNKMKENQYRTMNQLAIEYSKTLDYFDSLRESLRKLVLAQIMTLGKERGKLAGEEDNTDIPSYLLPRDNIPLVTFDEIKDHLEFIDKKELYWFANKKNFNEVYSEIKQRYKKDTTTSDDLKTIEDVERFFDYCFSNNHRVLSLINMKKVDLTNSQKNSPETLKFFDDLYHSIRKNKGVDYFLDKYLDVTTEERYSGKISIESLDLIP